MGSNLRIRRAGPDDAASLSEIGARLFLETYRGLIPTENLNDHVEADFSPGKQASELSNPEIASFLVEAEAEPVGFIQLRHSEISVDPDEPAQIELWRIYLEKGWHGQGVAGEMLDVIRDYAHSTGATHIWLAVWENNPRAISFYKKQGFRVVGNQTFDVGGETQLDFVMQAPVTVR